MISEHLTLKLLKKTDEDDWDLGKLRQRFYKGQKKSWKIKIKKRNIIGDKKKKL